MAFSVGELQVKVEWSNKDKLAFETDVATTLGKIEKRLPELDIKLAVSDTKLFAELGKITNSLDNVFAVEINTIIDKKKLGKELATLFSGLKLEAAKNTISEKDIFDFDEAKAIRAAQRNVSNTLNALKVEQRIDVPYGLNKKDFIAETTGMLLEAEQTLPDLNIGIDTKLKVDAISKLITQTEKEFRVMEKLKSLGLDIDLNADVSGFTKDIREAVLASKAAERELKIQAKIDADNLLKEAALAVESVQESLPEVNIDTEFDVKVGAIQKAIAKTKAEIRTTKELQSLGLDLDFNANIDDLVSEVKKAIIAAENVIPEVDVQAELNLKVDAVSKLIAETKKELRLIDELKSLGLDINLNADISEFAGDVRKAVIAAEALAPTVDIKTDVDRTKIYSQFASAIQSVEKLLPEMNIRADTSGLKPAAVAAGLSSGAVPASIGVAGAIGLGGAVQGVASGFGVKTAAELETAQVAFEGLLGSAEEANTFLEQLKAFTVKTPFEFADVLKPVQQLIPAMRNIGKSHKDVIPFLNTLGDVAAAGGHSADQIEHAVLAFAQMASQADVTGQEVRQLANSLPSLPIRLLLNEIAAEKWGVSIDEAKQKIDELGFTQFEFADIFDDLTKKMKSLPGVQDAMLRQLDTLKGRLSNLSEGFKLALGEMFLPALPGLEEFVVQLTSLGPSLVPKSIVDFIPTILKDLGPTLVFASNMFDTLFAAINPVIAELPKVFVPLMSFVTQFIQGLTSGGAVSVLTAIGDALTQIFDSGFIGTIGETIGMLVDSFGFMIQDLNAQGFFVALGDALQGLLVALQPLLPLFADLLVQLLPLAIPLLTGLTSVVETLVGFLVANPEVFNFFAVMAVGIAAIAPFVATIIGFFSQLGAIFAFIVSNGGIVGIISSIASIFTLPGIAIGVAIVAALPASLRILSAVFDELKNVFVAFSPVLEVVWNLFTIGFGILKSIFDLIVDVAIVPIIRALGDALVWVGEAIAPVADKLNAFLEFFKQNPGAAIGLLWEKIKDLHNIVIDFIQGLSHGLREKILDIPGMFIELGKSILESLLSVFSNAGDFIGKIADGIKNIFISAFGMLVNAGSWLKDNWLKLIGGIIAVPFAVGFLVGKLALKLGEFIVKGISMVISAVPNVLSTLWDVFVNILEFLFVTLPTKSAEFGMKLGEMFITAITAVPGLIANVGGVLWDGIKWIFDKVVDGVSWYVSTVIDFWLKLPGRVVDGIVAVGGWLWDGIRWIFDKVIDGVEAIIDGIIDFFVKLPGRIVDAIGDIGSFIWDGISSGFNFVKDNISSWIDSLKNLFSSVGNFIADAILSGLRLAASGFNKIIEGFNFVGNFVGMPDIDLIPEFHEGGRVGQGGKMRPLLRRSTDEQLAVLLTGEEVIPRNVVNQIPVTGWEQLRQGNIDGFMETAQGTGAQVNTEKLQTIVFESGGPLDFVKDFVTNPITTIFDAFNGIKDSLTGLLSNVFDGFGSGLSGGLGEMFIGLVKLLRDKVFGFFGGVKDGLQDNLGFDVANVSGDILSGLIGSVGQAGNYKAVIDYMNASGTPFVTTSTFRPFSTTASGALSYHAMGRAVDFAGLVPSVDSQALADIFYTLLPLNKILPGGIKELIYAGPQVGFNIKNGNEVDKYAKDLHHNHVHFAFANGGLIQAVPGGLHALLGEAGLPEMVLPMGNAKYDRRVQLLDNSGVTGEVLSRYHAYQAQQYYNTKTEKNVTYNVTQQLPPVSDAGLFASAVTHRLARL